MKIRIRQAWLLLLLALVATGNAGCVSKQVKKVNQTPAEQAERELPFEEVLDVVVTRFDPGIPETIEEQEKQAIYPEVREAESNFIPQVLRSTLDNTGYWGTVRVLPEPMPSSMVVVGGKILHSDGATLELQVHAHDATGRKWFERTYEEVAAELSYTEKSVSGIDPFQDLYNRIANDLLEQRRKLSSEDMLTLKRVTDLRFAADIAPARFSEYLVRDDDGRYQVTRLPPENDPFVKRMRDVRLRDDLLIDTLDAHYAAFQQSMRPAYQEWRRASYTEAIKLAELKKQALGRKVAGAAAVLAGIAAIATAGDRNSPGTASAQGAAGTVAIMGGVSIFASGMQKSEEAKLHAESLKELNQSIKDDVAPRVVKLEEKTITLKGSADEQYDQWRRLLQERYAAETGQTP